ncbi:MAG TPA: ATP-binding protein [Bryobacteraceae bacterium]|nr:ATP-binding protein [Bryobacteraceae bacterium]
MLHRRSIRFRLTVWYAAVLMAGLALFSGLLWVSLRHRLLADIDRELAGRATRLESFVRIESAEIGVDLDDELEDFCQALPETSYVRLRSAGGFSFHYPRTATAVPGRSRMLQRQFRVNGEMYDLELGAPAQDVRYVLGLLRLLLWGLVPVVGAIACIGGYWLSGRALKPVQDVTAAALMISIENLSGRLPVPATGDEIARLAEVLNSMLGRLESAVKTLSQFAADASHELRTPLAVIRTTAELALRRGRPPESYRESLNTVVAESERMTQLVEDLLTLARGDTTASSMPRLPVDLWDILREVHAEMASLGDKRQIQVHMSTGQEPAVVAGNRPALHRLFVLLLDNALKYSHAGGSVLVNIDRVEGRLEVTIRDFGSGIAEADLPHIFERFYRADRARSGGGHGLGLPLAETIARAHGATITVRSAVGEGSSFRVIFARRDVLAEPPVYPSQLEAQPDGRPEALAEGPSGAPPS